MLWYKSWLETRWRWIFGVVIYGLPLVMAAADNKPAPGATERLIGSFSLLWIVTAALGAGTGIKTQSATIQSTKGLHGSTFFTLSLPVRRSTLFAVRSVMGLALLAAATILSVGALWMKFGPEKIAATLPDALGYGVAMFVCSLGFYFLSSFLAIFLDAQWQLYASMLVAAALWRATRGIQSGFNVFHAFTDASPVRTHMVPWEGMVTSLVAALILIVVSLRVIETREF